MDGYDFVAAWRAHRRELADDRARFISFAIGVAAGIAGIVAAFLLSVLWGAR